MRKRVLTAFLALALAITALMWARSRPLAGQQSAVSPSTFAAAPSPASPSPVKTPSPGGDALPPPALAEARACVGGDYSTMDELAAWARAHAGAVKGEKMEWRTVQFRDPGNGSLYRATLEESGTESGLPSFKLKLFSVDGEGLPDPVPLPAGTPESPRGLASLLEGKELQSDIESRRLLLESGSEWHLETENGRAKEIDFSQGGRRLRCSSAYSSASCHCSP